MLTKEQKKAVITAIKEGKTYQVIAKEMKIGVSTICSLLKTKKRVLVISDTHCGHVAGLTPKSWLDKVPHKFYEQSCEKWEWFSEKVKSLKPDICFCLGDLLDGKGEKTGGTELITSKWQGQIEMAVEIFQTINAGVVVGVFGTGYHVGNGDDYENFLTKMLPEKYFKIGGHEFPKVHSIQFDLKHKIGSSSTPHGRFTPIARARLWNQVWNDIDGQPKSDVIIRGHVHYFGHCGDDNYLAIIAPALQGWGSVYGIRQCEGVVSTGLLWMDIYDGTDLSNLHLSWDIPKLKHHKIEVTQL